MRSLLGVTKEGTVTIRTQPIENPLLENLVLADTPGTGDPELFDEIARDFLPICDVIIFVFSAAIPLDQADLPLLRDLHERLPFIPIKFIVTRADELKLDPAAPVSDENLDGMKSRKFIDDITYRINALSRLSEKKIS